MSFLIGQDVVYYPDMHFGCYAFSDISLLFRFLHFLNFLDLLGGRERDEHAMPPHGKVDNLSLTFFEMVFLHFGIFYLVSPSDLFHVYL